MHAAPAYRGPDRRGADRTPPPMGLEEPRARFWKRASWVVPALCAVAMAAALFTPRGLNGAASTSAVLHLFQCVVALVAGIAFFVRWRMTGEAPVAWFGVALVVGWLPQIPLLMVDTGPAEEELVGHIGVPARLSVTLPFLWFLLRAARTTSVDSALRPQRTMVVFSVLAAVAAVGLDLGRIAGVIPSFSPAEANGVDVALATAILAVAWVLLRHSRSVTRPVSSRIAVVLVGLALSLLLRAAARLWWTPLWVVSGLVALMALVVLALVAASMLRSVLEFNGMRLLGLSLRADSAEETVRQEQERMHELRATVAGVRSASSTLNRYDDRVDPVRRQRLEEMMVAELSRLERLLDSDEQSREPGPVMLDDVIRPIVVAHRELGATIDWKPSGTCAVIRSDQTAEVLNVLLTNARSHACGAAVEISVQDLRDFVRVIVQDDGPGVSPSVAARAFDRGTRGPDSTGQGLGLHIARRLAADQGGNLKLAESPSERGATFVLTLRAVADTDATDEAERPPREETG